MKRRYFLMMTAMASAALLVGCKKDNNEKLLGHWLQNAGNRPASLHIKKDGNDYLVMIGQLSLGRYEMENQPAKEKSPGVLTIAETKQLKYDNNSDQLIDIDDANVTFTRLTEEAYKKTIEATKARLN